MKARIGNVEIGKGNPIAIQSMTNTLTSDVDATVKQIEELADAGSELVRITVNDEAAAKAVLGIVKRLRQDSYDTPIIGDFHYNGHMLLEKYPECAKALDKYRINPGNSGQEKDFAAFIEIAKRYDKPVRIGVNGGSLDQKLLQRLMEENQGKDSKEVWYEALVQSAVNSAMKAEELGLGKDKIVLSVKVSDVKDFVKVNEMLAERCDYVLHVGLTEAGTGLKGIVASSAALAILLDKGIGDTIRVSITPAPGEARTKEVKICKELLQSMGYRKFGASITSCPGCGRTSNEDYQRLAAEVSEYMEGKKGCEGLKIAVMGCIVNGPGESKNADIGISFPGNNENPKLPVYVDGKLKCVLEGSYKDIKKRFFEIIDGYIKGKLAT